MLSAGWVVLPKIQMCSNMYQAYSSIEASCFFNLRKMDVRVLPAPKHSCLARIGKEGCSPNTDLVYFLCPLSSSFDYWEGFSSYTYEVLMIYSQ